MIEASRIPGATYRLQLNHRFTFKDAQRIVPYLADLGVSDLYASPFLKADPAASTATTSPTTTRSTRRSALKTSTPRWSKHWPATTWACCSTSCRTIWASARTRTPGGTTCWRTARSPSTRRTSTSTGRPLQMELHGKVLLPMLGDQYGRVLETRRAAARRFEDGAFSLAY